MGSSLAEYARVDNLVSLHLGAYDNNLGFYLYAKPTEVHDPDEVESFVRERMPDVAQRLGDTLRDTVEELLEEVRELRSGWADLAHEEVSDEDIDWE